MASYHDTLRSPRWASLKWRRILHARFSCERCGRSYRGKRPRQAIRVFELHHTHYHTVSAERLEDVRIVCPDCHAEIHGL